MCTLVSPVPCALQSYFTKFTEAYESAAEPRWVLSSCCSCTGSGLPTPLAMTASTPGLASSTRTCIYACACACACARMCMRTHVHVHACACARMCTHVHVHAWAPRARARHARSRRCAARLARRSLAPLAARRCRCRAAAVGARGCAGAGRGRPLWWRQAPRGWRRGWCRP